MSEPLYCTNHPNVETYLRCNRCSSPICPKCAVRTEVGYRCPACVNQQQKVFYADFRSVHYLIAAAVALPLGLVGGLIIPSLGWFVIFLGPLVGTGIAEAASLAIGRRRGRYLWLVVAGSILVTGLVKPLVSLVLTAWTFYSAPSLYTDPNLSLWYSLGVSTVWPLVWSAVYLVAAVGTAIARLRPGR